MSYRLIHGRTVERDIGRIIGKQLSLAIDALESTRDLPPNAASHDARPHIKKIHAALCLSQPARISRYRHTKKRLNNASRLLAPLADDEAVLATMARVADQYCHGLSAQTADAIRQRLAQKHKRLTRKARLERVLPEAREILVAEGKRMRRWRLAERGFKAIASGLEKTIRDARRAMAVALEHPTTEHYHAWRRRAKSWWLQMRLLEGRCGGKLGRVEQRLKALDGCLGEHHNAALLEKALMDEAPASRQDTARCLRLVRRYQAGLRRDGQRGSSREADRAGPASTTLVATGQGGRRADAARGSRPPAGHA